MCKIPNWQLLGRFILRSDTFGTGEAPHTLPVTSVTAWRRVPNLANGDSEPDEAAANFEKPTPCELCVSDTATKQPSGVIPPSSYPKQIRWAAWLRK